MDDSVIKVLRRNGSWEKSNNKDDKNIDPEMKKPSENLYEEDFKLDDKFEVLAREIKKRMNNKSGKKKSYSSNLKKNKNKNEFIRDKNTKIEDINDLKKKILPYLKDLEQLIFQRQNYLINISAIDKKLDNIHKEISNLKKDYLITLNKMQENMNFFDSSLEIIKSAKEEK